MRNKTVIIPTLVPHLDIYHSEACVMVIIIIITTLFQEDNIFGTNASLTYMRLIITKKKKKKKKTRKLFKVCTDRTPSMLWAGYPTLLTWRGWVRFIQAQDNWLPHKGQYCTNMYFSAGVHEVICTRKIQYWSRLRWFYSWCDMHQKNSLCVSHHVH